MKKHLPTFEDFLNEGTEIEIISMTYAGASNTNRTESTKQWSSYDNFIPGNDCTQVKK